MSPEELSRELQKASELIDLGRQDQALALLAKLLVDAPGAATSVQVLMGVAHLTSHRSQEAARHAQAAIAAEPDFAPAYSVLGNALQFSGRHAEAVDAFQRALALEPGLVGAYQVGAQALSDLRRPVEATQWAQAAIALDPEDADGHFALGYVLHDKQPDAAMAAYAAALEIDPEHMQAMQNRATLRVQRGDTHGGTQMMGDVLAGTRGSSFTLAILDTLITQITLRLHRVTFFGIFLTNMIVSAVTAQTEPDPWPGTLAGVCLVGLAGLLGWVLSRKPLAALRQNLPRRGSGVLRGYPGRNPVATVWLGVVVIAWLLIGGGLVAAVIGAARGIPDAPFFLVAPASMGLILLVLGAILSWIQAGLTNARMKRSRQM